MTRTYDANGFRRVPATDRYSGMTAIRIDDDREIVLVGQGDAVEAELKRLASIALADHTHQPETSLPPVSSAGLLSLDVHGWTVQYVHPR